MKKDDDGNEYEDSLNDDDQSDASSINPMMSMMKK
jgi:hypothetical protein